MKSIIIGDIINSSMHEPEEWLNILKIVLNKFGNSPKDWEIFRGDSFQIMLNRKDTLNFVYYLKAYLGEKNIEVRMGIGVGKVSFISESVLQANGEAFIFAGKAFDSLKKKDLCIQTAHPKNNDILNLMFDILALNQSSWTSTTCEILRIALEFPDKNQTELSKLLQKSQSTISEGLRRIGYEEIKQLILLFNNLN